MRLSQSHAYIMTAVQSQITNEQDLKICTIFHKRCSLLSHYMWVYHLKNPNNQLISNL